MLRVAHSVMASPRAGSEAGRPEDRLRDAIRGPELDCFDRFASSQ